MANEIIPQHLAIKSMRASGYRDTAHAIAELIDNSAQAGEVVNERTVVEVLCVDRVEMVSERQRRRINRIAVYDNGSGMNTATLRDALQFGNGTHLDPSKQGGIGKFGMGLPNASISQCQRIDVYTWQKGKCLHSYLDVDEVEKGKLEKVPEPNSSTIPDEWKKLIKDPIGPHGTLVVWSNLDRVTWKSSKSLLENAESLVGRMYRYFIDQGKLTIRLAAFEQSAGDYIPTRPEWTVRPNDPLYLMKDTSTPAPYDQQPAFDLLDEFEDEVEIGYEGKTHKVRIRFSVAKAEAKRLTGNSLFGRHVGRNQGVSLVRAMRELELNNSFDSRSDPVDRWWGVEVLFDPALDDVFGVTNNKQSATFFTRLDLDDDAKNEGLASSEYEDRLRESGDPRLGMYKLSSKIEKVIREVLRPQIDRMGKGTRQRGHHAPPPGSSEDLATRATQRRRDDQGDQGASDQDEKLSIIQREKELEKELVDVGVSEAEAKQIAIEIIPAKVKFLFQEAEIPGPVIFDVKSKAGIIIININTKHPARPHLFELLKQENTETETPALKALKLMLSASARVEDEAGAARRRQMEDMRQDWGRMARDFLEMLDE